jgi:hypothetical protein
MSQPSSAHVSPHPVPKVLGEQRQQPVIYCQARKIFTPTGTGCIALIDINFDLAILTSRKKAQPRV